MATKPEPGITVTVTATGPDQAPEDIDIPVRDLFLTYRDFNGSETERRVTAKYAQGSIGEDGRFMPTMLGAYCHMRRELRHFRLDRIKVLADAETGEIIGDPAAWLRSAVQPHRPVPPVLRKVNRGLKT